MKYSLLVVGLFSAAFSFAQELKTFDTEYNRIMSRARQWEAKPENLIRIKERYKRGGRKVRVKTFFSSINEAGKLVSYKKTQTIKHFKSGLVSDRLVITSRGKTIGYVLKLNDQYQVVSFMPNSISNYELLLQEKTIIFRRSIKGKMVKEYYFK